MNNSGDQTGGLLGTVGGNVSISSSYANVHVSAAITATNTTTAAINYNTGSVGGDYDFNLGSSGFGGSLTLGSSASTASLKINGTSYSLIYALPGTTTGTALAVGNYALAQSLTDSVVRTNGVYTQTANAITFTGLGHTVGGLNITNTASSTGGGFFNTVLNSTVRDIGLTSGTITGSGTNAAYTGAATSRVAGRFVALRYRLARLQRFDAAWSLQATISGQGASKNLDSAEKFYLGGPYGVRAYPVNEGGGSKGQLVSADLHWRAPMLQGLDLSLFYDWGRVSNGYSVGATPGRYALSGWGLGASLELPHRVRISASVARRIGSNPGANPLNGKDQDGSLLRTRTWLVASLSF